MNATLVEASAGQGLRACLTLPALIEALAAARPAWPALTDGPRTLSFAEVRRQVIALAKALRADGVRKGDSVGILMGNRIEWVVTYFAAQYLGATVVALNTWYTAREIAYVLAHGDVSHLVMADRFLNNDYVAMLAGLQPWHETLPSLRRITVLSGPAAKGMAVFSDFLSGGEGMADTEIEASRLTVTADDVALLLYTSGSTARPKGVRLLHRPLIENCFDIGERQGLTGQDVMLLPVSLFWGLGCSNALMAAWTHGTHIVLQEHFEAGAALELIEQHRCTAIYGTSNMIQALMDHPDLPRRDIACLRRGVTFGSPEWMHEVTRSFLPLACQCYGFTEGYGNSALGDASDPPEKRTMMVGRVLPGSEMRIVDAATEEILEPYVLGEIRVRGHIMAGYHKEPKLTAAAFDADGFFRTGDLGIQDAEGFLQFRGRLKELVKTGGMNVSPSEVEAVLRSHPMVAEAFVTGLPDRARDEIVAAVVVPHRGVNLEPEIVAQHCKSLLAAFKRPRAIRIVQLEELPLTTTGKLHRARLAELFVR